MKKLLIIFLSLILITVGCKKSTDDITVKHKDTKNDSTLNYNNTPQTGSHPDETGKINEEYQTGDNTISQKKGTEQRKEITTKEVNDYINKTVTVKGYVAEVVLRPKVNYLNFDKKYPDNTFTAVIFPDDMYKFEDLMKYQNKNVKVTGRISLYKGKPQIVINSTSQLKIVN